MISFNLHKDILRQFRKSALLTLAAIGFMARSALSQQNDSLQQQTIDIYNVYQPKLRDAVKLNLNTSLPQVERKQPEYIYNIPAQNLYFSYQPIQLQPLAIVQDTTTKLVNNFLKAGVGSNASALVQLGLGNGINNKFNYDLLFSHRSASGPIKFQKFGNDRLDIGISHSTRQNLLSASFQFNRKSLYYYGYNHDSVKFSSSDIRQTLTNMDLALELKSQQPNKLQIFYDPILNLENYFDAHGRTESSFRLYAPFDKHITKDLSVHVDFLSDVSAYHDAKGAHVNNSLESLHPALILNKPGFFLRAGINPSWTNQGKFYLLPDIVNETHIIANKLILSSGWTSYFLKNSYKNISSYNPYITDFNVMLNTRVEEKYSGIKGTLSPHVNYNTKFSYIVYSDIPLYINDSTVGNTFYTVNEQSLSAYQLHAEIGYIYDSHVNASISGNWFNYYKQKNYKAPYGLTPFYLKVHGNYQYDRKFNVYTDIYALSGSYIYSNKDKQVKTGGALDVNLGAMYTMKNHIALWLSGENLLNASYQRWNNYPEIGFTILGGIQINF